MEDNLKRKYSNIIYSLRTKTNEKALLSKPKHQI
ncbi:hypothetical protein [Rickettsia canadensis]